MPIEVIPAQLEHVDGLAKSYYEAFKEFSRKHSAPMNTPGDIPSARKMYETLIQEDTAYPIAAIHDGRVAGSTWLRLCDEVAAFEDVNVTPEMQGNGIARSLMEFGLMTAREMGYERIHLTQSGHNATALSLYASLGFEVKEPFAALTAPTSPSPSEAVRELVEDDLDSVEDFSKRMYKVNRRAEVSASLKYGWPCFILEREGNVAGYLTQGHGIAQREDDAMALISHAASQPRGINEFHCPLRLGSFFQRVLNAGCRTLEIHNIMAIGPYETPEGIWMPSGAY